MRARALPLPSRLCVLNIKFAARVSAEEEKKGFVNFYPASSRPICRGEWDSCSFFRKKKKKSREQKKEKKEKRKIRHDLVSRGGFLSFTKARRCARDRLFLHRLRNDESETGVSLSGCSSALSKLF